MDVDAGSAAVILREHDYDCRSPPNGDLDGTIERIQHMKQKPSRISLPGPLFEKWCASDEDFRYFTRFPSKKRFYAFWASVEPSESMIEYWSEANSTGARKEPGELEHTPEHQLLLIDEFFMFCVHLSVGLKERVLAGMFGVSTFRVIQILVTWSNYLYLVLGSVQIWLTRAQVQQMMPPIIRQPSLCTRVIVACTELKCETGESSETSWEMKCVTVKALVGIAPNGLITFVSRFFPGSISSDELMRLSGVMDLLEPGDVVVAPDNFDIEDLLKNVGVKLVTVPLNSGDVCSWKAKNAARLHALVKCVIRRINGYQVLNLTIPHALSGTVNQIWSCCCLMANFQGPLVSSGEEMHHYCF